MSVWLSPSEISWIPRLRGASLAGSTPCISSHVGAGRSEHHLHDSTAGRKLEAPCLVSLEPFPLAIFHLCSFIVINHKTVSIIIVNYWNWGWSFEPPKLVVGVRSEEGHVDSLLRSYWPEVCHMLASLPIPGKLGGLDRKRLAPGLVKSLPCNTRPVVPEPPPSNREREQSQLLGSSWQCLQQLFFFTTFFLLGGSSTAPQRDILSIYVSCGLKDRAIFIPESNADKLVNVWINLGSRRLWKKQLDLTFSHDRYLRKIRTTNINVETWDRSSSRLLSITEHLRLV